MEWLKVCGKGRLDKCFSWISAVLLWLMLDVDDDENLPEKKSIVPSAPHNTLYCHC